MGYICAGPAKGIRNPVTRTGSASFRGYHPLGPYESMLERLALWVLAAEPWVERITTQPFATIWEDETGMHQHTPDILATGKANKLVIEVKRDKDATNIFFHARETAVRPILARYGYRYAIWWESHIKAEPRLSNARLLEYYRRMDLPQEEIFVLLDVAHSHPGVSVTELASRLAERKTHAVYALIAAKRLDFDRTLRLGPTTPVFSRETDR